MATNLPESPIKSPAAWLGVEQRERSDWIYVLSDAEKAELDTAIRAHRRAGTALPDIIASDCPLPTLGSAIARWMRELDDGRGFILVRGFPADNYGEEDCAFAYWLIGLHMGRPVAQNRNGDVLGHVRDDGADPKQAGIRLYRTRVKLDFHTDGADIIGLLCLKRAKTGGLSRIASSVSVFNEVMRRRPDLVPLLFEGFYWDREADAGPGRAAVLPISDLQVRQRTPRHPLYWLVYPQCSALRRSTAAYVRADRVARSDRFDRERSDLSS